MILEKRSITRREFILTIFCFMHGTVLRSGFIISITRQDSWIMAITGFLLSLLIIATYSALMKRFPGSNLVEINEIVFGRILGKTISSLYLFFFISLAALNTRDVGNFVVSYTMPETPIEIVSLLFLICCIYAIKKGISNIFHLSIVAFTITFIAMLINSLLIVKDANFEFLAPLLRSAPQKYVQGTVSLAAVPMGEVLVFTMLTPMLKNTEKIGRPLFFGILLSTLVMIVVMLRDIVTLGPLVSVVSLPTFESIRYVSLSDILTRLESIYSIVLTMLYIFKVTLLLYAALLTVNQILAGKEREKTGVMEEKHQSQPKKTDTTPPLLLLLTAFVWFYSHFVFESVVENMNWAATTAPFFSLTFEFFLPALTLFIAGIRKLDRKKEAYT